MVGDAAAESDALLVRPSATATISVSRADPQDGHTSCRNSTGSSTTGGWVARTCGPASETSPVRTSARCRCGSPAAASRAPQCAQVDSPPSPTWTLPPAPQSGGSGLATSFAGAIGAAVDDLVAAILATVATDTGSPVSGAAPRDVVLRDGRIQRVDQGAPGEEVFGILARHGLDELSGHGEIDPMAAAADSPYAPAGAFAARFAEVRVDEDLGRLRVAQLVAVVPPAHRRDRAICVMGVGADRTYTARSPTTTK